MFVKMVRVPIEALNPAGYNPRKISERALAGLEASISRFGLVEPIIWNKRTGNVVGGHQRLKVMQAAGKKELDVIEVDLDDSMEKTLNVALNNPKIEGAWTEEVIDLMEHVRAVDSDLTNMLLFDDLQQVVEQSVLRGKSEKSVLEEPAIYHGSSLFDARLPEWKRRKDAWISSGVDGGFGMGSTSKDKDVNIRGGKVGSSFDPVLCETLYRLYCPEGGLVLDPFCGSSVRGIVACALNRGYFGIDIRPEQITTNICQGDKLECNPKPKWVIGDSVDLDIIAKDVDADFFFTCPPYFDLEIYSTLEEDVTNMGWDSFKNAYREVIRKGLDRLKENRFACFVVGDVRDDSGFYRNLVTETIDAFSEYGARLYNESVLVTAGGSLPMRIRRQFGTYRRLGKSHQNILVFYKGDTKMIDEVFKETQITVPVMSPGIASPFFKPLEN